MRTYFFVRALREGNPTAKVLFDIDATFSNRTAIFTGISVVLALCFMILGAASQKLQQYPYLIVSLTVLFGLFALAFHFWSTMLHFKLIQIRRRLNWFHDYETNIRVKWGDDALEEMQQMAADLDTQG